MSVGLGYARRGEGGEEQGAIQLGDLRVLGEERVRLCTRGGVRLVSDELAEPEDRSIEVVVARSHEQRMLAWRLVGQRYAWRGYTCTQGVAAFPDPERQMYYTTLLALRGGRAVGTITLGIDSHAGMLVDEVYRHEVDLVRAQRRRTCELVRLAIEEGADSRSVWIAMLESLNVLCRCIHDITDMFIEVNPRHARFYRRVFGFRVVAPERRCPRVGAPSVLLRLKREDLELRLSGAARRRANAAAQQTEALAA